MPRVLNIAWRCRWCLRANPPHASYCMKCGEKR